MLTQILCGWTAQDNTCKGFEKTFRRNPQHEFAIRKAKVNQSFSGKRARVDSNTYCYRPNNKGEIQAKFNLEIQLGFTSSFTIKRTN